VAYINGNAHQITDRQTRTHNHTHICEEKAHHLSAARTPFVVKI